MLFNSTFSNLALSKVLSAAPLLSNTIGFGKTQFFGYNLLLSKFSSNFFFSNSAKIKLNLKQSQFARFINAPVKMDSITIYNETIITNGYKYIDDDTVNISQCIFKYCRNDNGVGGAISISFPSQKYPELFFTENVFRNCSAKRGGAIFAGGKNPSCNRNCFVCCSALEAHHAIALFSTDKYSTLELTSVAYCPGENSNAQSTISSFHKFSIIKGLNSTHNHITANGVFLNSVKNDNIIIRYASCFHCIGLSGFVLRNSSSISMQFLAIINNTLDDPFVALQGTVVTSIILTKSVFSMNHYANNNNPLLLDSSMYTLKITDSNIDYESLAKMEKGALEIDSDFNQLHDFAHTHYYTPNDCRLKRAPTTVYIKNVVSTKSMSLIIGAVSLAAIVVVFIIIFSYVSRIRQEEEWVSQNSRIYD